MINERIEEILEQEGVYIGGSMRKRIINAMKQYGNECVTYTARSDFDDFQGVIARLSALVQAQKELIDWLTPYTPYVHRDMGTLKEMQNKIKQLEA